MNKLACLYQLVLADFLERTRRTSFLVTMLGICFFGYLVITGKYTIQFGDMKTVYDSAWAGSVMAVCCSIILSIVGFYLVRGTISRDEKTQVGQIIAATPISRWVYIISKFFSNVSILWFMIIVLAVIAFVTLIFRNEAPSLNLWAFLSPFVYIALPTTVIVAAMAVFFDSVRWLRGSAGNVGYFFVAEALIVLSVLDNPVVDLAAASVFISSIKTSARLAFPGEEITLIMGFVALDPYLQVKNFRLFDWPGIQWSTPMLFMRLFWFGVAGVVTMVAVPFFDRFDPARVRRRKSRRKDKKNQKAGQEQSADSKVRMSDLAYHRLTPPSVDFSLLSLIKAELRLALKGRHWFWYSVAAGLLAAQVAAPFEIARAYLTPAAMVWPLVIWSAMGTRPSQFNTEQLLYSSAEPLKRQMPAVWMSGLFVSLVACLPMILRSAMSGHLLYPLTLLVAVFLVPSLSFAMGTISGSKKLFEVLYLMAWYVGSLDRVAVLDLLGTTDEAMGMVRLVVLSIIAIGAVVSAFSIQKFRLANA